MSRQQGPTSARMTLSKELRLLGATAIADRDNDKRKKRRTEATQARNREVLVSPGSDEDSSEDELPIGQMVNQCRRAQLLDSSVGGDIAAGLQNENQNQNQDKEKDAFRTPSRPSSRGKHSFQAIDPDNILLPLQSVTLTFDQVMTCPNIACPTKDTDSVQCNAHTLETEFVQCGLATELCISCKCCDWSHAIFPSSSQEKGDTPNSTLTKNKSNRESEAFHRYAVNYSAGYLMQKLGIGLCGLDIVFAFLGIAPNHGSDFKWERLMNRIGLANHTVPDEVMEENRKVELDQTEEKADEKLLEWLESEDGQQADPDTCDEKRDQLLHKVDGEAGIKMSADTGWQKRKIGKNGGDSRTGHNIGLGAENQLAIACQSYSQGCRIHELAEKLGVEPRPHRCPRNFDTTLSSKSMEGLGTVQHCVDIANSVHAIYVHGFVGDDDSTTRANLWNSYMKVAMRDYPHFVVDEEIPSNRKRQCGWPTSRPRGSVDAGNGRIVRLNKHGVLAKKATLPDLKDDHGKLPLDVPEPKVFLVDPQHRIRSFGTAVYSIRSEKKDPNLGLTGDECANAKRNYGYYIKRNQKWSSERFCSEADCVLLHLFNKHHKCDEYWCSALKKQAKNEEATPDDLAKFRATDTPQQQKLFDMVMSTSERFFSTDYMKQVHHPYQTQKNEAIQQKMTAVLPKDRHYGGGTTSQLHDRVRLIVVMDSLGEFEGMSRLYHPLGLPPLCNTMALWAAKKDSKDEKRAEWRRRPDTKSKRFLDKVLAIKEGIKRNNKSKKCGCTYESGPAVAATNAKESAGAVDGTPAKRKRSS